MKHEKIENYEKTFLNMKNDKWKRNEKWFYKNEKTKIKTTTDVKWILKI